MSESKNSSFVRFEWRSPVNEDPKEKYISTLQVLPPNNHCCYVDMGNLPTHLVEQAVAGYVTKACSVVSEITKETPKGGYMISFPRNRYKETLGHAYLWVVDTRVYNLLNKLNPDGSPRWDEVDDPDYEEDEITLDDIDDDMDWAALASSAMPPTIKVWQTPLMGRVFVNYTPSEYQSMLADRAKAKDCQVEDLQESDIKYIPKGEYVNIHRGYAPVPDKVYQSNSLFSRSVPSWITTKMILKVVKPLSTRKNYPIVSFVKSKTKGGRMAFITFDPKTNDAAYALLMIMKHKFVNPKTKEVFEMVFTFSFAN